jgi:two-component system cell cycle sensor histidine kinase/response regulator CckA
MNPIPDIGYHPARVLIVDDERYNRELLEVMLTPEGLLLQTAASGKEALAMVAQQPPDLILLDVMMPDMDGYQVAAHIKGEVATKNIPIIMVTALDDRDARVSGLSTGAEDFLTKPVDRIELCVRVRNLLRLKAYGNYYDKYSHMLEGEVVSRTADLAERMKQAVVLTEQAALLDLAQDAIVVRDMRNRILFWSRGAEVMYGWLSKEALGRNPYELLKTEFSEPTEHIEATLLHHGQWEGEAIHHRRDGTRVIVASRWALQRDADGAPVRILTINSDITDRKETDSKRKAAEEALEQIRKDQMRFKDEFLSHVSHELRSPLTAIKQFTSILLDGLAGELNKEQRVYQEIVLRNIRQLQSMIDDLLEITRLETGKLTVEPESMSVANAVTDTLNTLQETARAKGVTLSCDLPPGLPAAQADPTRLRQILIILLDNAIKFTSDGGAATIKARLLQEDPRFLLLEVSDTGCGMSPEVTERIFERLYQVSERIQTSRKGLGLGLFICKELVTRQGGNIRVKSQPQKGTTFSFTLPVFSLTRLLAPLLKNYKWPAESVALVVVEIRLLDAWPSKESQEEWSQEARGLIQRCFLPDLDVLLPKMSTGTEEERFFVAAFADDKGASVLANRIREQFEHLPRLRQTGWNISVSYKMLPPIPRDAGASTDVLVTSMATRLEESVKSHITSEAVYHEQQEDSYR